MQVITVCGSMDFFKDMVSIREYLEAAGLQVSIPAAEEVKVDYSGASDSDLSRMKKLFIDEHLTKIKGADAVLLANFNKRGIVGYVGANTLMEAAFAYALGKPVFVLNSLGEQPCRPEVLGMQPEFLQGELSQLVDSLRAGEQAKAMGPLGAAIA
jgi:nucleoside 2-deoxyribosyltransferase